MPFSVLDKDQRKTSPHWEFLCPHPSVSGANAHPCTFFSNKVWSRSAGIHACVLLSIEADCGGRHSGMPQRTVLARAQTPLSLVLMRSPFLFRLSERVRAQTWELLSSKLGNALFHLGSKPRGYSHGFLPFTSQTDFERTLSPDH